MTIHIVPILRDNYCYLIEGSNKECIIVDPGQTKPVQAAIESAHLRPTLILNTHHHADHVAGNKELKDAYQIPVIVPEEEFHRIPHADKGVSDGETIEQSGIKLNVIATPGHTYGHVSFYAPDLNALFCGDVIFSLGCGRLVEGTPSQMWGTLDRLKKLPPATQIYGGHEYTEQNGAFALRENPGHPPLAARMDEVKKLRTNAQPTFPVTLAQELETNPFLMAGSEQEFAELRAAKDKF